jgi:hypothetical protein
MQAAMAASLLQQQQQPPSLSLQPSPSYVIAVAQRSCNFHPAHSSTVDVAITLAYPILRTPCL